jgi:hypothetical protein
MTDIKNFISSYPSTNDEKLIVNLTHLEEFSKLRLQPDEQQITFPNGYALPMSHQELQARYFSVNTPYRKGLIYHSVGSGKTLTASLIVERFKDSLVDGKPRKPALILVRNKALRFNFINEIATVATNEVYTAKLKKSELQKLTENTVIELTEREKLRRLVDAISKTYDIITYGELLNNLPSEEAIATIYSNRVIVVDEVQNLREQPGNKSDTRYKHLHYFLHTIRNCTILLLTATPIWDKVYDIASVFNLLLPLGNDQLPILNKFIKEFFDSKGNLKPKKAEELTTKIRGMVSYIRALTSSAKRIEYGTKEPWLKYVKVFPCGMSDFQAAFAREAKGEFKDEENTPDTLYTKEKDALNCVYPIFNKNGEVIKGEYGIETFNEAAEEKGWVDVTDQGLGKKIIGYGFGDQKKWFELELGPAKGNDPYINLRKYSAKLVAFIQMLLDPNRLTEKTFYYTDSVKGTGGAISTALILQFWGFQWRRHASSIQKMDKLTVKSPGAFVVITSDDQTISEAKDIRETIEFWNRPDNIYGEYIRIIIGSEAISFGYTLKATRNVIINQGAWNLSGTEQALGRVFRIGSHIQLPENERYLNVYRYVAVYSDEGDEGEDWVKLPPNESSPSEGIFSTEGTVDTHIYDIAERKEHLNSQIYRLLKVVSWDCALAYRRNVLVNDIDGIRECDFMDCNYQCNNYPENLIDKVNGPEFLTEDQGTVWEYKINNVNSSNYNLLYSQKQTSDYVTNIIALFHNYFILRFSRIIELLSLEDKDVPILLRALEKIINQRILIRNMYGFQCYLKESNDTYFLDTMVSSTSDYLSAIYTLFPLVSERSSLEELVEVLQLRGDKKLVKKFVENPTDETFNNISHRGKIVLLERIIESRQHIDKNILKIIEKLDVFEMKDGNLAHNMYNMDQNVQTFDRNGKIRVFNKEYGVWENVDRLMEEEYIQEIKRQLKKKEEPSIMNNKLKVFASYDANGKFKIHDKRIEGKKIKGKVCSFWKGDDLYQLFYYLNHLPFDNEIKTSTKNLSDKELRKLIKDSAGYKLSIYNGKLDSLPNGELEKIYTLFHMTITELCKSLERFFKDNKLISV